MGGKKLSKRQLEVINLLAEGMEYNQIAKQLGLGTSTARHHIAKAYKVLGVHTARQAVRAALEQGIIRDTGIDAKLESTERVKLSRKLSIMETEVGALYRELDELAEENKRLKKEVEKGKPLTEPNITETQRVYLWAFDRYLDSWAKGDELAERRMRTAMSLAANGFLSEEIVQFSRSRKDRHPLEKITRTIELYNAHAG